MRSAAEQREGRGRLSSIDLLPDAAEPALVWALEQLRERKLPQNTILAEFNEQLLDIDPTITPISKSAWNRYAVRKAIQYRKQDETRRIAGELAASMGAEDPDEMTMMVAEMAKIALFELLEDGDASTKGIMEVGRALQALVGAQAKSADRRERDQRRIDAKLAEAAKKVGDIGKKKGVSKQALEEINRALLGQG